ncbi:MAG: PAS domain-containing protein [Lachnospiraceae bacterium]|nr:PAS domain-containing protein [Lachnospiraceae bacterium]
MEIIQFFKSLLDEDKSAVVICDINHKIIYMNPVACQKYSKRGGEALVGSNLLKCHNSKSIEMIHKVIEWFKLSKENNRIYTSYNEKENKDIYMIALRSEQGDLIGYYEKHEYRNRETEPFYKFD